MNYASEKLVALNVANWPIWTKEISTFPWSYQTQEIAYILDGECVITPAGGTAVTFGKGDLVGNINLRSSQFDANEWLKKDEIPTTGESKPKNIDTAKTEYFKVPAHIDFTANSQIGKILYEKIVLENAKGQIIIKDEAINLNDIFANLLGGTFGWMQGRKPVEFPEVDGNARQ